MGNSSMKPLVMPLIKPFTICSEDRKQKNKDGTCLNDQYATEPLMAQKVIYATEPFSVDEVENDVISVKSIQKPLHQRSHSKITKLKKRLRLPKIAEQESS